VDPDQVLERKFVYFKYHENIIYRTSGRYKSKLLIILKLELELCAKFLGISKVCFIKNKTRARLGFGISSLDLWYCIYCLVTSPVVIHNPKLYVGADYCQYSDKPCGDRQSWTVGMY
jgi:hypothetical protein